MRKKHYLVVLTLFLSISAYSQSLKWNNREFEAKNVKASLVRLHGQEVLKVERDLQALPFDENKLEATVDEPTYVKLKNVDFDNGTIEVKVLSRIQNPSPFKAAQGFIGVAFRIADDDSAFESIYLRPRVGRLDNQFARNHTVQYFAYPHFKFERLRRESPGLYETYADVGLDEWITIRIDIKDRLARLYIDEQKHASFIVQEMKANSTKGAVALWVDIGTEGYFKDLKITTR